MEGLKQEILAKRNAAPELKRERAQGELISQSLECSQHWDITYKMPPHVRECSVLLTVPLDRAHRACVAADGSRAFRGSRMVFPQVSLGRSDTNTRDSEPTEIDQVLR